MNHQQLDELVLASLRKVGGATPLSAVWDALLDATPNYVAEGLVAKSLRRLAGLGLVALHNGHGQMAVWRGGVRCRYWSTAETIHADYGYMWTGSTWSAEEGPSQ